MTFKEILEYNLIPIEGYSLSLSNLLAAFAIIISTRIIFSLIVRFLIKPILKRQKKTDVGRTYTFQKIIKYFLYTLAFLMALQTVGVQLSVLWAGSAALLVGIGFGLQQTFNDFISGLILLFEGSLEVGDVVVVEGIVGVIQEIGLRTTKLETRDDISHIIPNSKIVSTTTINWSHNDEPTRFQVKVGVAYGSDIDLVTKFLLQAASEHPNVLETPEPRVLFTDFGNSSLDFELNVYSFNYMGVEFLRSDLRYRIFSLFKTNNIEIPFPQRDIWIRNAKEEETTKAE